MRANDQFEFHEELTLKRVAELEARNARLLSTLKELVGIMEDCLSGQYVPDSFTTQPAYDVIAETEASQLSTLK